MSDPRQEALAEAYRRGIMQPEQKAAYEEAIRRGLVKGADRSWGQRFLDNLGDGFQRSGIGAVSRSADPQADGLADLRDLTRVRPGSPIDWVLDRTVGENREWGAEDRNNPTLARIVTGQGMRGTPRAIEEDRRRDEYAARASLDPIENIGDASAFLSGQVVGGGVSPENWIGGGSGRVTTAAGSSLTRRLATSAGEQALIAGSTDIALQFGDMGAGIEERYDVTQTLGAAALGATISVATDGVRPTSDMVRRAFTDRVAPRAPVPEPAPQGILDRVTSALTGDKQPASVDPEFGIVQPATRQQPLREALSRVREGELPQMVGDYLGRAYTAVVNEQHPLIRATNDLRSGIEDATGSPLDLLPAEDPRKLARGRYDWAAIGHQDLLHGVHAYRGLEPTTPAMADVLSAVTVRAKRAGEAAEAALQRFNEYMVARRASIEWDRHARGEIDRPPVARTKAQADAFVAHIDTTDPEFRGLSDAVNEYSSGLLKKARASGLISQGTYDGSLAGRDFYVPLRRVLDGKAPTGGKGAGKNTSSEVKGFRGSDKDVVDPVSVLIERTYRLNQRIRQNELNLSLIRLGERFEAATRSAGDADTTNGWLRKIDMPSKKVTVSRAELAKQAKASADMLDQMFDEDGVDVWRPGEINEGGRPILYAWRDGKREAWEVIDEAWGQDVLEAMGGMSREMQDTFLNTVAAGTTLLARSITRDPAFLFSNFVRDQVSSWIVTDVGFVPGESLLGVAQEFAGADISRVYNLGGGLSGGANTAMLGEALHKADTLALARKGIKAKYLSSLGGLLQLSEVTEVGTRLRVFKRAFDRATKSGLSEYDSLIEASFVARDLIDFGRHGSKMHYTRRLVTFLNAYVQGLDKTLRTLSADGAVTRVPLKEALRPLFGQQPSPGKMRAEDAAALKLAGRAWTKVAAISTFGLGLSAMFHDDPDYQQANERTRATHWVIPWAGNLVRIPKPFELAFLSNISERAFEATHGQDERAWGKMWRGLAMLFAPPSGIPLADVVGGLQSNTNARTGRPIVPEHLESMPPELQYQTWNSSIAKHLGGMLNVSPAKIDYALQGFGGPFGSYLMGASDAADPDRPSGSWTDLPVVRRFISPAFRGSQDKRDFYDRAGAKSSELRRALNGIREYQERGRPDAARAIFDELDEPGRLFVASQQGEMATRRLNPLIRAEAFAREASRMIGELNGADPKDEGAPLPIMSRQTRQVVEDAIERVTVAELRNAMVLTGQPGFQNRGLVDRADLWAELIDVAPEVAAELERRLGVGRDRAYDYDALVDLWPQVEERLRSDGSTAYLEDLAAEAQGRTRSWGQKVDLDEEVAAIANFRIGDPAGSRANAVREPVRLDQ